MHWKVAQKFDRIVFFIINICFIFVRRYIFDKKGKLNLENVRIDLIRGTVTVLDKIYTNVDDCHRNLHFLIAIQAQV